MKYYILLSIGLLLNACVQVANLNMSGEPRTNTSVAILDSISPTEEKNLSEVNAMKNFFSCDKDSLKVSYFARMLEVEINNPVGQCFGIYFTPRSVNKKSIIRFKAKYEGSDTLDFVAGFTDTKGGKCDDYSLVQTITSTEKGFKTFEFNYESFLASSNHTLDTTNVQTVVIYLNTKNKQNLKGLLTIKEIENR